MGTNMGSGLDNEGSPSDGSRERALITNERTKLTATYLNAGAAGFFTTGFVAPIAAAVFGITAQIPALTLGIGALIFLSASLALHVAARYVLKGLRP